MVYHPLTWVDLDVKRRFSELTSIHVYSLGPAVVKVSAQAVELWD